MTVQELADLLRIIFPTAEIKTGVQFPEIIIPAESLVETAHRLRNHEALSLDYLVSATAVDYADNLMLVYHIDSTRFRHMVVLKTFTSGRDNPCVDSVADQWPGAGFHECEIYDLFGIRFHNHPDLRRMFMEEDYGFPLRKDFRDETRVLTL